jgi:hypothetical protein
MEEKCALRGILYVKDVTIAMERVAPYVGRL